MRLIVIALSLTFIILAFRESNKIGKFLLSVLTGILLIAFLLFPTYGARQLLLACTATVGIGCLIYLRWTGFHFFR
jgi:hypothetical protein